MNFYFWLMKTEYSPKIYPKMFLVKKFENWISIRKFQRLPLQHLGSGVVYSIVAPTVGLRILARPYAPFTPPHVSIDG